MFKFILRPLPVRLLSDKAKRTSNLSSKFSNTPRPPKDPPDEGYSPEHVNHGDIEIADFIRPEAYRRFSGPDERLGPGAGKNKEYKNGQYFGYHRFSFVELQNQALELRDERRVSGGVPVVTDMDEQDECADISLEAMKAQEAENDLQLAVQAKNIEEAKLKKICDALENTQKKMAKLQLGKQVDAADTKDCSKESVNEVKRTLDKKVTEGLIDCKDKQTKALDKDDPKKDQKLAVSKEMVKEATEKAVNKDRPQEKSKASENKCRNLKETIDQFIKRKEKETTKNLKEYEVDDEKKGAKKSYDAKMEEMCAKLNKKNKKCVKGDEKKADKKPTDCETDKDKK